MMHTFKTLCFSLVVLLSPLVVQAQINLTSPNGQIVVTINHNNQLSYRVNYQGKEVLRSSPLALKVAGEWLGEDPKLIKSNTEEKRGTIKPTWGIRSSIPENYNELRLKFKGKFSVLFRAYDNGIAYRFELNRKGEITIEDEKVEYHFSEDHQVLAHKVKSFQTSFEEFFTYESLSQLKADSISLPLIIDQNSAKIAITEADLYDYPGMYLKKAGNTSPLAALFPKVALKTKIGGWSDFNKKVIARANYLAKTAGKRKFPWRVMTIHPDEKGLADNDLVYLLSRPSQIKTDWIKPGQVAWDWWNNWNLTGVDFEAGINNKTYEYYIDFASRNNIPYVILDEGWSETDDLLQLKKEIDLKHLVAYAKERNVRLILWCVWHVLDRQLAEALDFFESLDIAGIKVDFIDRDDQFAINYYERIAREAAKHQLLVDFHGCSKPTGLHRTYPNLINYEGVRGNEYNKFHEQGIPAQHKVDIVFSRMLAGPMDFTPGATRHSFNNSFKQVYGMPISIGTRANEIALFTLYYAPLQMLCDAPTAYEQHPEMLEFIRTIPTTWDETKVLQAFLRETVTIARRSGTNWFVGGITNEKERTIEFQFDFLEAGKTYTATIIKDGINAHRNPHDFQKEKIQVNRGDNFSALLKPGGGFSIQLKPFNR